MTQPSENEMRAPIIGLTDEFLAGFETITADTDELVEGGLAECDLTIIGMTIKPGGEIRKNRAGEEFETKDQVILQYRVDNYEELGLEQDQTKQFLTLPKSVERNGVVSRAKATKTSQWGAFIQALDALGVSVNKERAYTVHLAGLHDLLGLQFHRSDTTVETYNGEYSLGLPAQIYGFDQEVRDASGVKGLTKNIQIELGGAAA